MTMLTSNGKVLKVGGGGGAASMDISLFDRPDIFSGSRVAFKNQLLLRNISDKHTLALIGLKPVHGSYVNPGDIFEVVLNSSPVLGTANLSMGLFKMVGHTVVGSPGKVTFRRLTYPLPPRTLTGVRNDGGIPPYGQEPMAENPIRFTFDEKACFNNGELLYLGIAVAYDSNIPNDNPVFIGAFQEIAVTDYNDPTKVVNPVYYALGQSDKIGADGFTAREFSIGYSDADFTYATSFSGDTNVLRLSTSGISEEVGKTYPAGVKLIKTLPPAYNSVVLGGRRYRTTTIGGVTWLAENLDYKFSGLVVGQGGSTSEPRANYYNNDEATYGVNGNRYGLLYNWTAVKYLEDHKSELIPGWHVPTTSEWDALATAVGGSGVAGTKLKSTTGWSSGNGDDSYGFAAFPAGYYVTDRFFGLGTGAYFWTANEYSSYNAIANSFNTGASMNSYNYPKEDGYILRLVKDSQ